MRSRGDDLGGKGAVHLQQKRNQKHYLHPTNPGAPSRGRHQNSDSAQSLSRQKTVSHAPRRQAASASVPRSEPALEIEFGGVCGGVRGGVTGISEDGGE